MKRETYIRRKIEDRIMEIGINPNLTGFEYAVEAVEEILNDPTAKMQAVYYSIAKKHFASLSTVERNIRTCVRRMEKYKKTTNSEFLYEVALLIKREVEDERN